MIDSPEEFQKKAEQQKKKEEVKMERKGKTVELTDEDLMNVSKWIAATSMFVEAKLRTPFSESELKTAEKLRRW